MLAKHGDVTNQSVNTLNCPRNAAEVYYFGMFLQDSLSHIYEDLGIAGGLAQSIRNQIDANCKTCKDEIQTLIKTYLNQRLGYFYINRGPVMQAPVSDDDVQDIQPFFNKITSNFYDQLETMAYIASKGNMNANELKMESSNYIIGLLNILERLYSVDEVKEAFEDLIEVERNLLQ